MALDRVYRFSNQALDDLEGIADYLAARNPDAAIRVLETLHQLFRQLADTNEIGMRRDDLHEGIRLIVPPAPAHNYAVFFYPIENGVEISDVIHAARNWPDLFASGER